jgi:mono/diheme cytochrome c family protein
MKRFIAVPACVLLAISFAFAKDNASTTSGGGVVERGTVRSIRLPESPVYPLSQGKGRETVSVRCAVCHTLAYIPMQPRFSRETWTAEVVKMQKTYGAQITDAEIPAIVDYLMEVRGAATTAAKTPPLPAKDEPKSR